MKCVKNKNFLSLVKSITFICLKTYIFYFGKYFSPLLPNHTYSTKNNKTNFPNIKLQIERIFSRFRICKLMNEIPEEILEQQSKYSLKKKLKKTYN